MPKNIWGIGLAVILVGAIGAMWFAGRDNALPSTDPNDVKNDVSFEITTDDHVKGLPTAKVTLVEFADFQCPACQAYHPLLNEVFAQYPNDLRIVYRHFPLKTIHTTAVAAARASEAANLQGKFWEMHAKLFENQTAWAGKLTNSFFEKYAEELGLDVLKFKADLDSDLVKDKVENSYKDAVALGLSGTPTFYLNGKKIVNPRSVAEFTTLINTELGIPNVE
jgi:protein-disulfide isomerase